MQRRQFLVSSAAVLATTGCLGQETMPTEDTTQTSTADRSETSYPQAQTDTFVTDADSTVPGPTAAGNEAPTVRSTPTPERSAAVALSFGEWYTPARGDFAWTATGVTVDSEVWLPGQQTVTEPLDESAVAFGLIRAKNISQSATRISGMGPKEWAVFDGTRVFRPKGVFRHESQGAMINVYPQPDEFRDRPNIHGYIDDVASGEIVDFCYPVPVPVDTPAESLIPVYHEYGLETEWGVRWYRE